MNQRLIFWQNIISMHQAPFIRALSEYNDVTLVVEQEEIEERKKECWTLPDMGNAKIIVAPDIDMIKSMTGATDTVHIFSGINSIPTVYAAFKEAVKNRSKISVMAEPYNPTGLKGFLRKIMYSYLFYKYKNSINHFFATGELGVECYRKCGFPKSKLHQWGYFTEICHTPNSIESNRIKPNLIFIGKLNERKNILSLIEATKEITDSFEKFYIIGGGPLEIQVLHAISNNPKYELIGNIPNNRIYEYLAQSDLLVLPSLFDGWGAVVNEALIQGCRVLCSDKCGSSVLLDGNTRGGTFEIENSSDLVRKLKIWLGLGPLTHNERENISKWAKENISGETVARYFFNCIDNKEAKAPWLGNY